MYVLRTKKELRRDAIDGFIKTVEHLCLKKIIRILKFSVLHIRYVFINELYFTSSSFFILLKY